MGEKWSTYGTITLMKLILTGQLSPDRVSLSSLSSLIGGRVNLPPPLPFPPFPRDTKYIHTPISPHSEYNHGRLQSYQGGWCGQDCVRWRRRGAVLHLFGGVGKAGGGDPPDPLRSQVSHQLHTAVAVQQKELSGLQGTTPETQGCSTTLSDPHSIRGQQTALFRANISYRKSVTDIHYAWACFI